MKKEIGCMKKIIILSILVMSTISCSYFEGAEKTMKERGYECTYNGRGEAQVCGYIK